MVKNYLKKILKSKSESSALSTNYLDQAYKNKDYPFLISFPRTGSHWLRMMMELYFEKPALTRAFYFHQATDFTCVHHHDVDLKLFRKNFLYLYRDVPSTVYSQMSYDKENLKNLHRIKYWSTIYALHLEKYLLNDNFSQKKVVLTYEGLVSDLPNEFRKICDFFHSDFNKDRLQSISGKIDKRKLKEKTGHDKQVVNLTSSYKQNRQEFIDKHKKLIFNTVLSVNSDLHQYIYRDL